MKSELAIAKLITARMSELEIGSEQLGFRLGYLNRKKGAGRVHALCYGHLKSQKSTSALAQLAKALEIPEQTVGEAIELTTCQLEKRRRIEQEAVQAIKDAEEAKWKAQFKPHAIIVTESRVPSQITICALSGGPERWLRVELDFSQPRSTFVQQVTQALPAKLRGSDSVTFFGRATGFVINYATNRAVRFTLAGEALEILGRAYRLGKVETTLSIRIW